MSGPTPPANRASIYPTKGICQDLTAQYDLRMCASECPVSCCAPSSRLCPRCGGRRLAPSRVDSTPSFFVRPSCSALSKELGRRAKLHSQTVIGFVDTPIPLRKVLVLICEFNFVLHGESISDTA